MTTPAWRVTYTGIFSLSIGMWLNDGADAGFIAGGICLMLAGIMQVAKP